MKKFTGRLTSIGAAGEFGRFGLGFVAPQINGKDNVSNPAEGEIVYDSNESEFYGRTASGWTSMGGASALIPVGTVLPFAGSVPPAGFFLCEGQELDQTTYADLYAVIGDSFGSGATTFNLPDLRGEFLRGFDNGRGVDSGRVLGSSQGDKLRAHNHRMNWYQGGSAGGGTSSWPGASSGTFQNNATTRSETTTTDSEGNAFGSETRPRNVAINFIIKY